MTINEYIEGRLYCAEHATTRTLAEKCFEHAYGALEFYLMVHPEDEAKYTALWDNYGDTGWRAKFETVIAEK